MPPMRPTRGFRLLALAAAASAWALVAVGGIVRVTESGLGCPDWPLCAGRVVPEQQKEPMIETSHRWVAGLVTVLVVLGEESAAHERLAMLHVAGAATVWAALIALVALVGAPRPERRARRSSSPGLGRPVARAPDTPPA